MPVWKPFKTAPKDGTLLVFWISSQKGFEDITANFYYHARKWWWECDDSHLKRPDLVNGWMIYPQPPKKFPNAATLKAFQESKNPKKLPTFKNFRALRNRTGV
jgi:hypothetical protein